MQTIAIADDDDNSKEDMFDVWLVSKGCIKTKNWDMVKGNGNISHKSFTIQTYIRNYIHHPENHLNTAYTFEELKTSIDGMRQVLNLLS